MPGAPEHLTALIRTRPSPLVSLTLITALASCRPERTFRLVFADGSVLKARQLESEEQAASMQRLTALAGADFSQVLARLHDTVLEEWVPGRTLSGPAPDAADGDTELLARCGAMLGRLHARAAPTEAAAHGVAWAAGKVEEHLREATARGALSRDVARDVQRLVKKFRPAGASVGFVHVDFCGDNLVASASGRIVCVDNATLRLGPHDYDLARSWYRWPLNEASRAAFLAGYSTHRSPADFARTAPFWLLQALLVSVAYRARIGSARVSEPVARLRRLLDAPDAEHALRDCCRPLDAHATARASVSPRLVNPPAG